MIDTHFKSEQNQFLHLDTETILSAPLYILLENRMYVDLFSLADISIVCYKQGLPMHT